MLCVSIVMVLFCSIPLCVAIVIVYTCSIPVCCCSDRGRLCSVHAASYAVSQSLRSELSGPESTASQKSSKIFNLLRVCM